MHGFQSQIRAIINHTSLEELRLVGWLASNGVSGGRDHNAVVGEMNKSKERRRRRKGRKRAAKSAERKVFQCSSLLVLSIIKKSQAVETQMSTSNGGSGRSLIAEPWHSSNSSRQ